MTVISEPTARVTSARTWSNRSQISSISAASSYRS
jgi:hypothetical protein